MVQYEIDLIRYRINVVKKSEIEDTDTRREISNDGKRIDVAWSTLREEEKKKNKTKKKKRRREEEEEKKKKKNKKEKKDEKEKKKKKKDEKAEREEGKCARAYIPISFFSSFSF